MFDESGSGESLVNPVPWYQLFNDNITSNNERIISEIMGTTLSGDVVSFAGGIPSPELYPVQTMGDIITELMETSTVDMFYNSPVRGHYPLRESISQMLVERHMLVSPKEVIIISGSQQGLDYVSRLLISHGDIVIVEEPSYFGAIQIFRSAGDRVIRVSIDKNGLQTELLEPLLSRHKPKFIYTLPTFQNPSGVTMSLER